MKIPKGQVLYCPICGRAPKYEWDYPVSKAQCKPLFRKPHLTVYSDEDGDELIERWNNAVMEMIQEPDGHLQHHS